MRKNKVDAKYFEKSIFMITYLREKHGESWHLGNNKKMYERYKEAEDKYFEGKKLK